MLTVIFFYLALNKINIKRLVHKECGHLEIGDEWVGCTIDLSIKENDAKYCQSVSIFSPYPGICMENVARQATDISICQTLQKPYTRKMCYEEFNKINTNQ